MATQTLTYASTTASTSSFTKLTIPNASTIPRTKSVESVKLVGRNPSPPPPSTSLQRSSSASEMLALVNLANLQRLHIRASEPSSSSGGLDSPPASPDEDNDEENAASSGSSASSSDSEECETPDQVSPPFTRPASPIGYIYDYDSEDEESWDIRKVKYTAGAELAPCFSRGTTESAPTAAVASSPSSSLRSSFSDSEDDEDEEDDGMMMNNKKGSWSPGTPAIEKVDYHWSTATTPSSSASSSAVATPMTEDEDGYFDDNGDDDDDMIGSELDAGEVWPDEMDSDDFPYLHSWPHSWIWTPPTDSPSTYSNPTPNPLPMIHFHFVESQVPDQSSWTPIQDSRFGGLLTVPGHRAYNTVETLSTKARMPRAAASPSVVAPMQQLCEGAKVEYDDKLGRCAVKVPGLKEQREMGLYSIPSFSNSSSSSSKKGRGRARSRVRDMEDDEAVEVDLGMDDARGRGRSSARKMTVQSARHFVLSSIREADDGDEEYEEEPFAYDGVRGRARGLSSWD